MKTKLEQQLEYAKRTLARAKEMYVLLSNAGQHDFDKNETEGSKNALARLMEHYEQQIAELKEKVRLERQNNGR